MLNLFNMFLSGGPPRANQLIPPKSHGRAVRLLSRDGTFNDGRNQEKREARAQEKRMRAAQVATRTYRPKNHLGPLMVKMLSDRRLRQRNGGL